MKPLTKRWTDVVLSFLAIRLMLWLAVVVHLAPGWLAGPWNLLEFMDDHHHHALDLIGRTTYLKYHQFPLWNPYMCGGTFGIAEPETIDLAPDFIIRALLWGPERGRHVVLVVMTVIGCEGMFRLARKFDCSVVAAAFAGITYATQYSFLGFVHDGASNFLTGFELMPWAVLCFYEGLDSFPWRLLGGFVAAWIFLCAGTYPTPYTTWVLAVACLTATVVYYFEGARKDVAKPWITIGTMGAISLLLACAKLLPLLSFLGQFKRVWTELEIHPAQQLFGELTSHYPWLFVAAFAAIVFMDRWAAYFIAVAALFFVVAMGDFGSSSPYYLIKQLPFLGQLRQPERYLVIVIFHLSLAGARGITRFEDLFPAMLRRGLRREPVPRFVQWSVVGISALAVGYFVYPRVKESLSEHTVTTDLFVFDVPLKADQPFRQARGNRRDPHVFNYTNVGSLACVTGIGIPMSAELRADLPAEEYPLDPNVASVKRLRWTPDVIDLEVTASAPTRIIINQNWNKHFVTSVGHIASHNGLLAIDVPAGKHNLRVRYRDRVFSVCIAISAFTLIALVAYAIWYGTRRVAFEIQRFRALPWFRPKGPTIV